MASARRRTWGLSVQQGVRVPSSASRNSPRPGGVFFSSELVDLA